MLTGNPLIKTWHGLYEIWLSTALPDYFPLTSTTFWLEWRVWGMHAAGYHLTNVLLHAANAVPLWRVMARLRGPGAWLVAVVWAIHPVCVASAAWIAERKNTLSMFFFLLSILWYLWFDIRESVAGAQSPDAGDFNPWHRSTPPQGRACGGSGTGSPWPLSYSLCSARPRWSCSRWCC